MVVSLVVVVVGFGSVTKAKGRTNDDFCPVNIVTFFWELSGV